MRRIAMISEHASPIALLGSEDAGGQNVYVDEISRRLADLGYLVDVFTRRDCIDLPTVVEWVPGVRVVHVDAGPSCFMAKDDLWPLMPAFRDAVRRFAVRDGVTYDLIHGNFWMSGWVASELGRALGIPVVQLFHALGATKQRYQGSADTSPPDRIAVERDLVQQVDRVIATCPREQSELIKDYGADHARIAMIPLAVDTDRFRPVERDEALARIGFNLPSDRALVVYVGRLLPRKGIRDVVRALALMNARRDHGSSPVNLLIVGGDGRAPDPSATPEIGVLQRLAAELGISDLVHFTGKRQQDELRDYYSAGDVVVTTPWYEPFGLTPLEAMACARPVVGSAVGGITYTIRDGETGLFVPPREPDVLAERLDDLLHDRVRRITMGKAARARVVNHFTWTSVAHRTAELYESMSRPDQANWRLVQTGMRGRVAAERLISAGD